MLYTGWGPLVFVVYLIITFGAQGFLSSWSGERRYFFHHQWAALLIFALSGVVVWFVGRFMNRKPVEVLELDEHGRKIVAKPRHTIWYIPAEYWGPILFLLFTFIFFSRADP